MAAAFASGFQFLIGRLGTQALTGYLITLGVFQFLIGRLGTTAGVDGWLAYTLFQFLIGRLGTDRVYKYFLHCFSFNSS